MRNQFSLLTFCGKVPLDLLEAYLTEMGVCNEGWGSCLPWDTMKSLPLDRRSLALIRQAIVNAPSPLREQVLQDFVDVDVLATDQGLAQLIATGKFSPSPVDLTDHLALYEGSHAKALFVRLEWPDLFRRAVTYHRVHGIAAHRWYRTGRIDGVHPNFGETAQDHLREAISHYFCQQGRGRGCEVTVEERGEDLYTFVYPEDYARRCLVFDQAHALTVETLHPAFEIILVYHRETQTVDCFATCPQGDRKAALQRYGRIMLDVDFFPDMPRVPVFRLDALKFRGYPFPAQREDDLLSVRVVRLRLVDRSGPDKNRITVDAGDAFDEEALYDFLDDKLGVAQATVQAMDVEEVQLRFYFRGKTPTTQPISRTVALAMPDMLRLSRNDRYYLTIRTLLRRWQLDVAHTVAAPVFGH